MAGQGVAQADERIEGTEILSLEGHLQGDPKDPVQFDPTLVL